MSEDNVLQFPSAPISEETGEPLPWDGRRMVGLFGEGGFNCDECASPLALVPFADKIHGAPRRAFYCERCHGLVAPEQAVPKIQQAIDWMQEVVGLLTPQEIDREALPEHKDPTRLSGLVTPDGQSVDALRRLED